MKIMIVDDHPDMRRTLRNYVLLSLGKKPEVVEYETGEEAISEYTSQQPDFVLMDIELQSMSGFTAAEEILKKDPQAKIVIVTSYDTRGFRRKAIRIGARGFVAKDKLSDLQTILISKENNYEYKGTL